MPYEGTRNKAQQLKNESYGDEDQEDTRSRIANLYKNKSYERSPTRCGSPITGHSVGCPKYKSQRKSSVSKFRIGSPVSSKTNLHNLHPKPWGARDPSQIPCSCSAARKEFERKRPSPIRPRSPSPEVMKANRKKQEAIQMFDDFVETVISNRIPFTVAERIALIEKLGKLVERTEDIDSDRPLEGHPESPPSSPMSTLSSFNEQSLRYPHLTPITANTQITSFSIDRPLPVNTMTTISRESQGYPSTLVQDRAQPQYNILASTVREDLEIPLPASFFNNPNRINGRQMSNSAAEFLLGKHLARQSRARR